MISVNLTITIFYLPTQPLRDFYKKEHNLILELQDTENESASYWQLNSNEPRRTRKLQKHSYNLRTCFRDSAIFQDQNTL